MKLLIVIYDSGVDESINALLDELKPPGYTKLFGAHGLGGQGLKLGDVVWPGTNNLLYLALDDHLIPPFVQRLRQLQAQFRLKPGITILSLPADLL
jgi:hypothetical protein